MNVKLSPSQMWIPEFENRYFWDFNEEVVFSCISPDALALKRPHRRLFTSNDYVCLSRAKGFNGYYRPSLNITRGELKMKMNLERKKLEETITKPVLDISHNTTCAQTESVAESDMIYVFNTQTSTIVGQGKFDEMVLLAKRITLDSGVTCELLRITAKTIPFKIEDVNLKVIT